MERNTTVMMMMRMMFENDAFIVFKRHFDFNSNSSLSIWFTGTVWDEGTRWLAGWLVEVVN